MDTDKEKRFVGSTLHMALFAVQAILDDKEAKKVYSASELPDMPSSAIDLSASAVLRNSEKLLDHFSRFKLYLLDAKKHGMTGEEPVLQEIHQKIHNIPVASWRITLLSAMR